MQLLSLNLLMLPFISFLLTFFLLKLSIPYLRKYFIDKPNIRSSHVFPKPRAGGIIFVFVITFLSFFIGNYQFLIYTPLAIIGFLDDLIGMPKFIRYFVQLFTVIFLMINSPIYILGLNNLTFIWFYIFIVFFIILGTSIINFTNFMDGSDGIVAGSMILIFMFCSILISDDYLIVVGSLLGFLFWNWSPSKVFMGDIGSTFLGALLVGLIFDTDNLTLNFKIIILISPLLIDPFVCVLRRLAYKQRIFEAHCSHLYQRLIKSGWTHSSVAILYMISIIFLAIAMFKGQIQHMVYIMLFEFCIGFYLDQKVAIPFKKSLES